MFTKSVSNNRLISWSSKNIFVSILIKKERERMSFERIKTKIYCFNIHMFFSIVFKLYLRKKAKNDRNVIYLVIYIQYLYLFFDSTMISSSISAMFLASFIK